MPRHFRPRRPEVCSVQRISERPPEGESAPLPTPDKFCNIDANLQSILRIIRARRSFLGEGASRAFWSESPKEAPKARDLIAQGNALGSRQTRISPEGERLQFVEKCHPSGCLHCATHLAEPRLPHEALSLSKGHHSPLSRLSPRIRDHARLRSSAPSAHPLTHSPIHPVIHPPAPSDSNTPAFSALPAGAPRVPSSPLRSRVQAGDRFPSPSQPDRRSPEYPDPPRALR